MVNITQQCLKGIKKFSAICSMTTENFLSNQSQEKISTFYFVILQNKRKRKKKKGREKKKKVLYKDKKGIFIE